MSDVGAEAVLDVGAAVLEGLDGGADAVEIGDVDDRGGDG